MSTGASTIAGGPLRVLIVEDHTLVRAAVADTLTRGGLLVTGQAGTGEEALALLQTARPDVVLVDIDLPGMGGIALVRELVPRLPDALVIILTASHDDEVALTAMRAGAAGYLTKDLGPEALTRAILAARDGELPMPRRLAARIIRELTASERRRMPGPGTEIAEELSVREEEVLTLVSRGMTDREIAEHLGISPRTVGHHVGNVLAKLGVHNRAVAARVWRTRTGGTADADDDVQGHRWVRL
jgi:DNA-binding NarL/FixJ family response regulator